KEQLEVVRRLGEREIDIVIGTHRLLSNDVRFKDLGLLIVDEEQRFGVAHKERLKKMRTQVDVLTLTATPIPRTMNMAMMGLREVVPEARVAAAHGQMESETLERVMVDFVDYKHDILVCTTIIESGLDIPRANTMFVNRADAFGLAQLYQLRGRIGRGRERAFCYLMIPPEEALSADAKKRLAVL